MLEDVLLKDLYNKESRYFFVVHSHTFQIFPAGRVKYWTDQIVAYKPMDVVIRLQTF